MIVQIKNEHNHSPLIKAISRETNHQAGSGKFSKEISKNSLESVRKILPVEKSKFYMLLNYFETLILAVIQALKLVFSYK